MKYMRRVLESTPGYSDYLFVCEDGRIFRARCNGKSEWGGKESVWSFYQLERAPESRKEISHISTPLYSIKNHCYQWDSFPEFVSWLKEQEPLF